MYIPIRHAQILKRDFTVCVSPLQLGFDKAHELVEMIELNRILGADYFFFYNYSASPNIDKVLEHYSNRGLVKIIQWRLPFPVTIVNMTTEEIHYYGQLAVINDCVYRNKGATSFVVNQDIDEFIIPRKQNNWNRMVNTLPTKRQCYMIRSAFFRKDWPDVNQSALSPVDRLLAQRYMSVTILKQVREDVVFPAYTRSKWMARPECIEVAGVHNIHNRDDVVKCKTYVVLLADGLLHHYRSFEERVKVKNTTDNRISILKDDLLKI
ncbi:hypothetical protein FSP39_020915 [Pinctada imbricata]|uniref:Glycosyltransferase family 92 protein n=1 Tax=Pinctada imbricata TaxID=66713 RepID=A0AA88XJ22_PINIB|nr:hypothetical protein FSP39_020915 [Pinctada imbricata]